MKRVNFGKLPKKQVFAVFPESAVGVQSDRSKFLAAISSLAVGVATCGNSVSQISFSARGSRLEPLQNRQISLELHHAHRHAPGAAFP